MIIVEETVESRLNSEDNLANKLGKGNRKNHETAGRKEGDVNLHPVMRSIISAAARLDTAKNVADNFDVSPGHAHQLKHGKTTPGGEVKEEILEGANRNLEKVRDRAMDILMDSLNLVTPEKMKDLKATSLTNVAKDAASIIEKLAPKEKADVKPSIVIVTAPRKALDQYNVIEVDAEIVGS